MVCTPSRTHPTPLGFDDAPSPSGLAYYAIDISNYQPDTQTPEGLSALLVTLAHPVSHVVVRLSIESDELKTIARNQLQAAQTLNITVAGYAWIYAGHNQHADAQEVMALASAYKPTTVWLDIEGSPLPTSDEIRQALEGYATLGQASGIYTGEYIWPQLGNPDFSGVRLWSANYNGADDLNVPTYGNMRLVGHQFIDKPVDQSVFSEL